MNKKLFLVIVLFLGLSSIAFAGTGGAELSTWYTDLSGGLKGAWGKVIAVAFIAIALMLFKNGAIIAGVFMIFLGLSVGTIPDIVDAKFTALAIEQQVNNSVLLDIVKLP